MSTLRIGTRGSALAMAQSGQIGEQIVQGTGHMVELVQVRTTGDVDSRPLTQIGGTGVFVTAVRQALLEGRVDVVVHSMKDLPTTAEEGIAIACVPPREDPRDALISRDGLLLAQLPTGARVGTGSPRRAAQLRAARPDLVPVPIRGNIDTRMARALGDDADLDAVVLAAAGLRRLGREADIAELLEPTVMLPAPAQGTLALEVRAADATDAAWFAPLLAAADDPATRAAADAERSLLRALEAGCSAPVAAYAEPCGESELQLRALAISVDGQTIIAGERRGTLTEAAAMGRDLAAELLGRGADRILAEPRG